MTRPIDPRDIAFMAAVEWSERMLLEIDAGWQPPCDSAALRQVRNDAMRAMASDLPDVHEYAAKLPPEIAAALMDAVHGRNGGLWAEDGPLVPLLRSMGLIAINDRQLTGWAMEVRWALREDAGDYVPVPKRPAKDRPLTPAEVGTRAAPKRRENNYSLGSMDGADLKRVESSVPCTHCGSRPDACCCRGARR